MSFLSIIAAPELVAAHTETGWFSLEKSTSDEWGLKGIQVRTVKEQGEMRILITSKNIPVKRIQLRWKRDVAENLRILGDHWERGYGDLEWRGLIAERVLPWYFYTFDGVYTHAYGVKTGPRAMCFWQVDRAGVSLWIDIRSGGVGVRLGKKELHAASVIERRGTEQETPFEAAQHFCKQMCTNPRLPKNPVYGGNNWYYAYGNSSAEEILEDTRLITSLSPSSENRPFMVIDDGWQICHSNVCNGGPWFQGNYKFPDMEGLAGKMKELGAKPGIWMRPVLTTEKVPSQWVLNNKRLGSFGFDGKLLDPSEHGVIELIHRDVERIKNWGYELIKHDFSTYDLFGRWGFEMGGQLTGEGWSFSDQSKTTAEIVLDLYQAIRDAAGDTLIIGCNTVSHLAAGIVDIQRTGDDTSGRDWERTRKYGINTLAYRMPHHDALYAVDADCVGLTKEVPWELNKQWLQLLAFSGTPLFVSASPDAIGKDQELALREAFEAASKPLPTGIPLDWLSEKCPSRWVLNGEEVRFDWYGEKGVNLFN